MTRWSSLVLSLPFGWTFQAFPLTGAVPAPRFDLGDMIRPSHLVHETRQIDVSAAAVRSSHDRSFGPENSS